MPGPNQLDRGLDRTPATQAHLLEVHGGVRTEAGLRENIRDGVQYVEAWLRGRGAVPLYNLMEDAATAEIGRTQVWQWLRHRAALEDGRAVTPELFEQVFGEEIDALQARPELTRLNEAARLFRELSLADVCPEFLTLPAYELLEA
jgi:malate synthase